MPDSAPPFSPYNNKIFLITAHNSFYGSGHFHKSTALKKHIPSLQILLYKSPHPSLPSFAGYRPLKRYLLNNPCNIVVLDKREIPSSFLQFLRKQGSFVIVFDALSSRSKDADFLIQTLPSLDLAPHKVNLSGLSYLDNSVLLSTENMNLRDLESFYKTTNSNKLTKKNCFCCLVYLGHIAQKRYLSKVLACLHQIHRLLHQPQNHPPKILHVTVLCQPLPPPLRSFFETNLLSSSSSSSSSSSAAATPISLQWMPPQPSLIPLLSAPTLDLFLCHYGVSAYQALLKHIPLLLLSPSRLHHNLAQKFLSPYLYNPKSFCLPSTSSSSTSSSSTSSSPSSPPTPKSSPPQKSPPDADAIGTKFPQLIKILQTLRLSPYLYNPKSFCLPSTSSSPSSSPQKSPPDADAIGTKFPQLIKILQTLRRQSPLKTCCPFCSKTTFVVHRLPSGNLYRCRQCDLIYLKMFPIQALTQKDKKISSVQYDTNYFIKEYQKTYGKTYAQDKPQIMRLAARRLQTICSLLRPHSLPLPHSQQQPRLLEIGPAYGYFLDQAKQKGFITEGIEISKHAAAIAQKNHLIHHGAFPKKLPSSRRYQVVALWFVLEHFTDPQAVVHQISRLQQKGDILALSTPNAKGFMGRFQSRRFFETSPSDHTFLFTQKSLKLLMQTCGYRLVHLEVTGIHPHRFEKQFPRISRFVPQAIYRLLATTFCLGDTFQLTFRKIYQVKNPFK